MKLIQIRVDDEQYARIEKAAAVAMQSVTGYCRAAVGDKLAKLPIKHPSGATASKTPAEAGTQVMAYGNTPYTVTGLRWADESKDMVIVEYVDADGDRYVAHAAQMTKESIIRAIETNGMQLVD